MILPEFRAIVEYSVHDGQHYYTIQICRSSSSKPEKEAIDLKSKNDYIFYIFNRFPLDGFELTGTSFKRIVPFVNYFRNGNVKKLKTILKEYSQEKIPFDTFLREETIRLNGDRKPPETQSPAYEPLLSIKEVSPNEHGGTPQKALDYSTFKLESGRVLEYAAMLKALGYKSILTLLGYDGNTKENLRQWIDKNIMIWGQRNAQVYRLANLVPNAKLGIGDIQFCERGQHYWHYIDGKTKEVIRKFYVIEKKINSRSLEAKIDSIPRKKCPDAIDKVVEREGIEILQ